MVRAHGLLSAHGMTAKPHDWCGSKSYTSIFNTTYNINLGGSSSYCGGGIKGFWGGFGAGLGQMFGGFLGGLMGGFGMGNMFGGFGMGNMFGGFGMGNMFGGFGMGNMFGSFGLGGMFASPFANFWDGSTSRTKSCNCKCDHDKDSSDGKGGIETTTKTVTKEVEDKDQANLNKLEKQIGDIKKNLTKYDNRAGFADLYKQVKAWAEKPIDEQYSETNKAHYERLLADLKEIAKQKGWNATTSVDAVCVVTKPKPKIVNPEVVAPDGVPVDKAKENDGNKQTYSKLADMNDADKNLEFVKSINDNLKAQYYAEGYTNYDGKEEVGDVKRAHDNSGNTNDTVNINGKEATITKAESGKHPQKIVLHDSKDITYTFAGKAGSEYIYESDQDDQLYVLQQTGSDDNTEYYLMQYEYMKGYGKRDWQ